MSGSNTHARVDVCDQDLKRQQRNVISLLATLTHNLGGTYVMLIKVASRRGKDKGTPMKANQGVR